MAKALPQEAKIGPFTWRLADAHHMDNLGTTSMDDLLICIRGGLPKDLRKETLFHELCHAALFCAGVDTEKQEKWVQRISPFLYGALCDNPELRHFLF